MNSVRLIHFYCPIQTLKINIGPISNNAAIVRHYNVDIMSDTDDLIPTVYGPMKLVRFDGEIHSDDNIIHVVKDKKEYDCFYNNIVNIYLKSINIANFTY